MLDSSATLAWIFGDETTKAIERVFDEVAEWGAVVPSLWRLEVANCLTAALRRGRIEEGFRRAALADLSLLDVVVDAHTDANAWGETVELAERFGLTLYDAAYVELAARRALPLATLDADMRAAGRGLGLRLLGIE
ncbi:type II toxin-antitoxin system VapC family toxin [Methylocystis bryophila]|uniref:type II toxin-antitoxin system VapC family toxin n=1 Tax=Methylocystis bryophila TaxID=655015 RepID=UPI001FD966BA|nr:type II toxin-antitoxin system VapC family toxin [Methylocystis bryophila]